MNALAARAEQADSAIERASVWLEYFEQGTMLNDFMEIWVRDLGVLLDAITLPGDEPSAPIAFPNAVDASRIGLLGMSYGGGAVTEVCKIDARCRVAVNLDGGLWGRRVREPLRVPYLVLRSPDNEMFFEYDRLTSEAPYYALTVEGAMHLNFTDVSVFVPFFKWLGLTGPIEGERVVEITNTVSERFFDAYLRDATSPSFESAEFPEVSVQTNESW